MTAFYLHQQADSSSVAICRVLQDLKQRSSRGVNDAVDVAGHEEQHNQENGTGEGTDSDTSHHNLWSFGGSIGDFYGPLEHIRLHLPEEILPSIMCATASWENVSTQPTQFSICSLTNPVTPSPP